MMVEKPIVLAQHAARKAMDKMGAAVDAVAKIIRKPSKLRAQKRAQAEERMLDELLDHIADAGKAAPSSDDAREDRGPLMPRIDPLFGLLIGALAVWVLFAMLALLSKF